MTRLAEPRRSRVDQPSTDGASLSAFGKARSTVSGEPLSKEDLRKLHALWREHGTDKPEVAAWKWPY